MFNAVENTINKYFVYFMPTCIPYGNEVIGFCMDGVSEEAQGTPNDSKEHSPAAPAALRLNAHNESVSATDCLILNGWVRQPLGEFGQVYTYVHISFAAPPLSRIFCQTFGGDTYKEGQTNAFLKSVAVHAGLEPDLGL